jgi:transcriptional repressor NrdR
MLCQSCRKDTKVLDSRVSSDGFSIRRRRECAKCGFRFSTLEEMDILDLAVIKRNGRREPYSREKLENGLKKALEKRAVSKDEFRTLINRIERDIQLLRKNEIKTQDIGEIVMKHLKRFDKIAYIRFASVYRQFEDVKAFKQEVEKLTRKARR